MLIFAVLIVLVARSFSGVSPADFRGEKVKGRLLAPIQIQEFSDFQCPACQKAAGTMKGVWVKYPNKILFTFYHFPLRMHPWSQLAHECAECAAEQNKFWDYHDLLYENQTVWSKARNPKDIFLEYAKKIGLDFGKFTNCVDQNLKKDIVAKEVQMGRAQQITSTPTFFINGRRLVGGNSFDAEVYKLIDEELKKAGFNS